ncbi:zinc ribbon domain-containing protein, partial [Dorea formicigenerans]|nr:zinc ribbon domain-containing protein [Dorea formicigenerans]
WEEDLLEDGILYDGERVDIEFVITEEDLDWEFAIEDFEGNVLEFYGLSFAEYDVEGATLILEYDGYKGT